MVGVLAIPSAYIACLRYHRAPVISDAFSPRRGGTSIMPSPTKPSTADEAAFMANLLANPPVTPTRRRGLPSHKPSPVPPRSGQRITCTPTHQLYSVGQVDIEEEISGWNWDALSDYVPTPKKSCNSPRKPIPPKIPPASGHQVSTSPVVPKYAPDPCTRCLVQTVTDTWGDGVREKVRTSLTVHLCL
jgi:DNA replication ATP-dependent helicase Dna2